MKTQYRFLITAGSTREKIDEVRDWGNIFTGQTGLDIALAFADLGDVLLLTSNAVHASTFAGHQGKAGHIKTHGFRTHAELLALLEQSMQTPFDTVLMTAAVADYSPAGAFQVISTEPIPGTNQQRWIVQDAHAPKIKSTHNQIAFLGKPTLKLIDQFRTTWNFRGTLVKFKLEVGISEVQLIEIARASRIASGANLIVANTLEMVHGPTPAAYILGENVTERVSRPELPMQLRQHVAASLITRK